MITQEKMLEMAMTAMKEEGDAAAALWRALLEVSSSHCVSNCNWSTGRHTKECNKNNQTLERYAHVLGNGGE